MTWVRIDDRFAQHPKVVAAGPLAMAMQVAALGYCNRELTDGFIPRSIARTLMDCDPEAGIAVSVSWVIGRLIQAGMWEEVEGGYRIHDFHDYQPTKEEVLALREKRVEAGRIGGLKRAENIQANEAKSKQSAKQDAKQTSSKPLANSKQNSNPVPVPVSHTRIPVDPLPEPEPSSGADAPSDATPYGLLEILCETTARDIGQLTTREKNGQLAIAKRLIADAITGDDVRGFVGYLQTQDWRSEPITMWTVEKSIGTWRASGRPARAVARASPNGKHDDLTYYADIASPDPERERDAERERKAKEHWRQLVADKTLTPEQRQERQKAYRAALLQPTAVGP